MTLTGPHRAGRGKSDRRPEIFHVRVASAASGGKSERPVQIFHTLRVEGTGEAAVGDAATAQRGFVHVSQLRLAGLDRSAVRRMVRRGVLCPYLPRVYAVGHLEFAPLAVETATLLWLGHDAVVSHRSAAAMWGLVEGSAPAVEVTLIGRDARPHHGITSYRVPMFDAGDVRLHHGLPVTSPARTIVDISPLHEPNGRWPRHVSCGWSPTARSARRSTARPGAPARRTSASS